MFRYLMIIALVLLTGACGGGKKSSRSTGETPVPIDTTKKFKIGGVVKGLNGNLAIANGTDTVTVGADGGFVFAQSVSEGALYNVKIVALPQNQLCELRNSKNYAYRDHYDIAIECATLVERNIRMSLPANIQLDEVRLLSNYQAKGGQGEEQLSDLVTKMMVFDNSVVSLRNADNQILLLAYLGDITAEEFELSSKSTAIAFMLLEPTIVSAIQDRGWKISEFADELVTGVNANGDIDRLATEIQNLIIKNGNLNSPSSTFSAALGRVLDSATRVITSHNVASAQVPNTLATAPKIIQRKLSTVDSSDALGVAFNYAKATDGSSTLHFSAANQNARYISLHSDSDKFAAVSLSPYSSESFEVVAEVGFQENFNVLITGPGALGVLSDANVTNVLEASVTSGVNQHFLPSVNALLGLKDPSGFNTSDCLSADSIETLGSPSNTQNSIREALLQDKYFRLLTGVSFYARSQFISSTNTTNQTPVVELFACEKFGLGVLIANKKAIAIENTTGILTALNGVFNPANLPISLNLFALPNVSLLSEAIRNSYAERTWVLSTVLQFEINANTTQVLAGNPVQFTSSCKDPSNNAVISCDVTWDFGDGNTATGNTVANSYLATGHYLVTATAKDADGAQQTQTINIDVLTFSQDNNAFGQWVVTQGGTEQPLNSVRAKTFFDDANGIFQIRLFSAFQQDNPQISLSLKGYDFNANAGGDGIYSLDDTSSGETCLGFYGDDTSPAGAVYCTSSTGRASTLPFTGSVTVTTDTSTLSKKAVFEFEAFNISCTTDIATCDSVQVSGEVQFDPGF